MKINKSFLATAIVLAGATSGLAQADTAAPSESLYHIYIGALFDNTDSQRALVDNGRGFTGSVGIPLTSTGNNWHVEVGGNNLTLKTPGNLPTNFFRQELSASLVYSFGNRDELTPYVLAGVGAARQDVRPDNLDETVLTGHIGVGLVGALTEIIRGRIEVKGVYDDFRDGSTDDDGLIDTTFSLGVEIPLGRKRTVEVPVAAPPQIVEKEVIKEVQVGFIDTDGDKISDADDKCPGTLPGVRTDNSGCALAQAVNIPNIEFDFNKASLKTGSQPIIDSAASFFRQQPNLRAVVAGHTDDIGKDAANQKLSQARANSVVKALTSRGLDAKRFKAVGMGESMPLVPNVSNEDRATNRRVEFLLSTSGK